MHNPARWFETHNTSVASAGGSPFFAIPYQQPISRLLAPKDWRKVCLALRRPDYDPSQRPERFTGQGEGRVSGQDKGTPRALMEVLVKAILSSFA